MYKRFLSFFLAFFGSLKLFLTVYGFERDPFYIPASKQARQSWGRPGTLGSSLVGTVLFEEKRFALVRADRETKVVGEGEKFCSYTMVEVKADSVVVQQGSDQETWRIGVM